MRKLLTILVLVLGFTSCEFNHLHYETNKLALVRIDIDWSEAQISPNGVSAYVFDAEGKRYSKVVLSSDPNCVYLKLAPGEYTVVLHNNSFSELSNVKLIGGDYLDKFCIRATEQDKDPVFTEMDDDKTFVHEPSEVVSYTLRDVVVDASDLKYHYYEPDLSDYEQEVMHAYKATPHHIVHQTRVTAFISGLEYAKGAPVAILRGMSGGYHFDNECTTDEDVLEQFYVNTKITRPNGTGSLIGDYANEIFVDYNTFGMHDNDAANQKYHLDIRFTLLDGTHKDYSVDVSNDIKTDTTGVRNLHTIEVKLDPLPEVEDPENPEPEDGEEGAFDPSLDEWVEIKVDLPM